MTIDLTNLWRRAIAARHSWSSNQMRVAVNYIAQRLDGSQIEWDLEDGESWARVLKGNALVALAAFNLPIVLLHDEHKYFQPQLEEMGENVLVVRDMASREYAIDVDVLVHWQQRSMSEVFDPNKFSIDELWYATT